MFVKAEAGKLTLDAQDLFRTTVFGSWVEMWVCLSFSGGTPCLMVVNGNSSWKTPRLLGGGRLKRHPLRIFNIREFLGRGLQGLALGVAEAEAARRCAGKVEVGWGACCFHRARI